MEFIVLFAFVLFVCSIIIHNMRAEKEQREYEEYQERKRQEESKRPITAEELYQKCKAERVLDCVSPADQARIALIGRRHNLTGTDSEIIAKYRVGKNAVEGREKQKRIAETMKKEQEILNKHTRYLNYSGRDKRVKMCYDMASDYRLQEEAYMVKMNEAAAGSYDAYRATAQRERSWSVAGGIANGLAGPAAGVAAALDTQRTNAEIRERNQKLAGMISEISVSSMTACAGKAAYYGEQAEKWEAEMAKAQTLLVQEYSKEEQKTLLDRLQPRVVKTTLSETGSVILEISFRKGREVRETGLKIYEDVTATIDGFYKAKLWQGDKMVGDAMFGMEWDGSENWRSSMVGVCWRPQLDPEDKNFTVTFEPHNLWAIEYRQ